MFSFFFVKNDIYQFPFLQDLICDNANMICDNFILDVWQGSDYASFIFSKIAGLQSSAYNFTKDGLIHRYFPRILNTYLKERLWTAILKVTKVYESPCKRCGVTPQFFHQGKNVYQNIICPKIQCSWSGRCELRSLHNLCKNKLFGRSANLKSCYIPWLINFNNFQMKRKIWFIKNWFGKTDFFFFFLTWIPYCNFSF